MFMIFFPLFLWMKLLLKNEKLTLIKQKDYKSRLLIIINIVKYFILIEI